MTKLPPCVLRCSPLQDVEAGASDEEADGPEGDEDGEGDDTIGEGGETDAITDFVQRVSGHTVGTEHDAQYASRWLICRRRRSSERARPSGRCVVCCASLLSCPGGLWDADTPRAGAVPAVLLRRWGVPAMAQHAGAARREQRA